MNHLVRPIRTLIKYLIDNKYSSKGKIIGMGGSILGTAIYEFLKDKIKKNFYFINNLRAKNNY